MLGAKRELLAQGELWHAEDSHFVESMMTVVAVLKQQPRHGLEYLTAACEADLRGDAAPSLLPKSAQNSHAAA
jgi:hypothetical protein